MLTDPNLYLLPDPNLYVIAPNMTVIWGGVDAWGSGSATITYDAAIPDGDDWVGQVVMMNNEMHTVIDWDNGTLTVAEPFDNGTFTISSNRAFTSINT